MGCGLKCLGPVAAKVPKKIQVWDETGNNPLQYFGCDKDSLFILSFFGSNSEWFHFKQMKFNPVFFCRLRTFGSSLWSSYGFVRTWATPISCSFYIYNVAMILPIKWPNDGGTFWGTPISFQKKTHSTRWLSHPSHLVVQGAQNRCATHTLPSLMVGLCCVPRWLWIIDEYVFLLIQILIWISRIDDWDIYNVYTYMII